MYQFETAIPLKVECEKDLCSLGRPIIVNASLSSPLEITPQMAVQPPAHSKPGCMAASENPSWRITNNRLTFTAQQNEFIGWLASYDWNFVLTNVALDYAVPCRLQSTQLGTEFNNSVDFEENGIQNGPLWFRCWDTPSDSNDLIKIFWLDTSFRYQRNTDELFINQTWYCDDESALTP